MPEETKAPVINRNGISLPFIPETFGHRSPNAGKTFFTPPVSGDNLEATIIPWIGKDDTASMLFSLLRAEFSRIHASNVDPETGEFDEEQWAKDAADFTAGFVTLNDYRDQIEDLEIEQDKLLDKWSASPDSQEGKAALETMKANSPKIKNLRAKLASAQADADAKAKLRAEAKAKKKALAEAAAKNKEHAGEPVPA